MVGNLCQHGYNNKNVDRVIGWSWLKESLFTLSLK